MIHHRHIQNVNKGTKKNNNSYKPITNAAWVRARLCKLQKGALDSQPQVIKFTSHLPMVGGSLRVLRFLPPLKLVAIMERIVLFRWLLYIFSFVGLILCVVSLVLPYWITFSTPAISGHQGLFFRFLPPLKLVALI
jgi:hypothetical protein